MYRGRDGRDDSLNPVDGMVDVCGIAGDVHRCRRLKDVRQRRYWRRHCARTPPVVNKNKN
jgi:hypothetical protein